MKYVWDFRDPSGRCSIPNLGSWVVVELMDGTTIGGRVEAGEDSEGHPTFTTDKSAKEFHMSNVRGWSYQRP